MSRYCLDTSAYSRYQRGEFAVTEMLQNASWIGVPAVTLGELQAGFARGARQRRNEEELAAFLSHSAVEVIAVDQQVAAQYAAVVTDLRRAGTPIPNNDIWIAACAAHVGVPVLTFDAHFTQVARVGVVLLK